MSIYPKPKFSMYFYFRHFVSHLFGIIFFSGNRGTSENDVKFEFGLQQLYLRQSRKMMKLRETFQLILVFLVWIIPGLSSSWSREDPNLVNQILDSNQGFNISRCSNPSGSLDSAVLVETEDGELQDFTTVQVSESANFMLYRTVDRRILRLYNSERIGRVRSS